MHTLTFLEILVRILRWPFAALGRLWQKRRFRFDIDERALLREIGSPQQQGAEDASRGQPRAEAVIPPEYEQKVVQAVEKTGENLQKKFSPILTAHEATLGEIHGDCCDPSVLQTIRQRAHELERPRLIGDCLSALHELKEQENNAKTSLKLFQQEHGLKRPEESRHWIFALAIIILIIAAEAGLSGVLLKDVQSGGLRGAYLLSVLFSAFNVAFAGFCGAVFGKNLLHVKWYRKGLAFLGLLLAMPAMLMINGWFATVRAIAIAQHRLDVGLSTASDYVWHAPLQLIGDSQNLWMIALGMVFSIFAFYEGMHLTDPYPGYSKFARRFDRAKDRLARRRKAARRQLNRIYDRAAADLRAIVRSNARVLSRFHAAMREYQAVAERHTWAVGRLTNLCTTLVFAYRAANMEFRGDRPPPRFFATPPRLSLRPASFSGPQVQVLYNDFAKRVEYFERVRIAGELRLLGELRLWALAHLDWEIGKALGEPVNELPRLPPLPPEIVAPLSVQPRDQYRRNHSDDPEPTGDHP